MSTETLKSLFGHKSWANSKLFSLLATLPPEHSEQLHTCIRTLNHIGACQAGCRLGQAAKGWVSMLLKCAVTTESRSGLSVTASM